MRNSTIADFSQVLLAAAKLYLCWIVIFLTWKHSPEGQLRVLPLSQRVAAPAANFRFGERSGTTFGPGNASVRKAASCWRPVAPRVLHNAPRDGPRCPKGLQKLAFKRPWATLLERIGERLIFARSMLFTMSSLHRATPGLSTVASLRREPPSVVPNLLFCVPWRPPVRPSVAAGRHRELNVTPNGLKKRPGGPQKSMKSTCCGLRGTLDALRVSRGTPLAPKITQNIILPTLAERLKEPCTHAVQQERIRKLS